MRVDLFDFDLPESLIALRPAVPRESARLLAVAPEGDRDCQIADLPSFLKARDLLLFNDTRVLPARLRGKRGNVAVEMLLHRPLSPSCWRAFARPAKRLKAGDRIEIAPDFIVEVGERLESGEIALLFPDGGEGLHALLDRHGTVPLPPYIEKIRPADAQDRADYQTVYAAGEGASVAAPTAGLHFTPALLERVRSMGVSVAHITLHVGAGTFQPVKVEDTENHVMHAEWAELSPQTAVAINETRARGGRVIAVGTTSLRTLESAADEKGVVRPFSGETDIFITPGYRFRAADMLLTNFHLPRSTLFMLVCAFAGMDRMKAAYARAIAAQYRFYSYGDACLIYKNK